MRYSFLFLFLGFGFGREGSWVVDLKGQIGEINGFREGQPPTMHNLNPFSETVKSVRKKKGEAKPFGSLTQGLCVFLYAFRE